MDHTDDWMNPTPHLGWQGPPQRKPFIIERAKKSICFGDPGYVIEWHLWADYDTREARDAALTAILQNHPLWKLRARQLDPLGRTIDPDLA